MPKPYLLVQLNPLFLTTHSNFYCPQTGKSLFISKALRVPTVKTATAMCTPGFPLPTQARKDFGNSCSPSLSSYFPFLAPNSDCRVRARAAKLATGHHPLHITVWSSLQCTEGCTYSVHTETLWLSDCVNYNIWMCSQIVQNEESVKTCGCKLNKYVEKATLTRLRFCVAGRVWRSFMASLTWKVL